MSNFDPSEHSYGAPPRPPHAGHRRKAHRPGGGIIGEDRRKIRELKQKIAVALNLAIATGGLSAAVMAARHHDPHKLAHELHEAEIKLHYDLGRIGAKKHGRHSPSMAEVRRKHRMKTPQQAGQEAVDEENDSTGTTADANDAAAADVPTAELVDADNDATSVGVTATADAGSKGSTALFLLGALGLGALAWKASQKRSAHESV